MAGDQPVSWLMFFTLVAAIVVAAGFFIAFLGRQRNRDIAQHALVEGGNPGQVAPQGALPDLLGLLAIALVAMGLLAGGYATKEVAEKRPAAPSVSTR